MKKYQMRNGAGMQRVGKHTARVFLVSCLAMSACASPAFAAAAGVTAEQRIWVARYTFSGENPVTVAELADVLAEH